MNKIIKVVVLFLSIELGHAAVDLPQTNDSTKADTLNYQFIGSVNGKHFYTSANTNSRFPWADAMDFCNKNGLKPASISSQAENNMLKNFLAQYGGGNNFWVPATDFGRENSFYWVATGYPISYSNWAPTDPHENIYFNCVEMLPNGLWYMQICNEGSDNGGYHPIRKDIPLCEAVSDYPFCNWS